jgi:hypothetical protein
MLKNIMAMNKNDNNRYAVRNVVRLSSFIVCLFELLAPNGLRYVPTGYAGAGGGTPSDWENAEA